MKILLAEDDALTALSACEFIAGAGHKCVGPVSTRLWAMEAAAEHAPDCAIIDVILRDGYTGYQLAHELRREYGIPCAMVTGTSYQENDHFPLLKKPLSDEQFLAVIRQLAELSTA